MKTSVILFLGAVLCGALAEPLRYRQAQQVRASAKQTDGRVQLQAELGEPTNEASGDQEPDDEGKPEQGVTEPSIYQSAPAPYPPRGWVPFGQLLVLPVAVREEAREKQNGNLESTTTVESSTSDDSEATEQTPTTEAQSNNGQLQEVETSEPKTKLAAHKQPGSPGSTIIIVNGKKTGQLKVEAKQKAKEESTESNETTTETADEATTTTDAKSENLETTSEPDAEAVDVEKANEKGKEMNNAAGPQVPPSGFFIQLPDGSFQRIVYVAPQTPQTQAAFVPQPANVQAFQQLNQSPNFSFGFNPITNPRIVTFSTQYNAW